MLATQQIQFLQTSFGDKCQTDVETAPFTSARMGGKADVVLTARSIDDLIAMVKQCRENQLTFIILGGGSNVLVSDQGIREVVIHNRANGIKFQPGNDQPAVETESGANFGKVARMAGAKALSGMEWACGIPGTVGGAVVGNAGAHGGEIAQQLKMAEILHVDGDRQTWNSEDFAYSYRTSIIKRNPADYIVLSAVFELTAGSADDIKARMDRFMGFRRKTQPAGASMGSIFKNPIGDHAGRLIEEAGLKGTRIGGAEISEQHANFFLNHEDAKASDMKALIDLAVKKVRENSGIILETEIGMIGDWASKQQAGN